MNEWYVITSEQVLGPYNFTELQNMAHAGSLYPHSRIRDGNGVWMTDKEKSILVFANHKQEPPQGRLLPQEQGKSLPAADVNTQDPFRILGKLFLGFLAFQVLFNLMNYLGSSNEQWAAQKKKFLIFPIDVWKSQAPLPPRSGK